MSNFLSTFKAFGSGHLTSPGDMFSAKVTKSGRQVVKLATKDIKRSAVRYPGTGKIVETIVYKEIK